MPHDTLLVFCTHPDPGGAEALARELVESRLAAGVNILPPGRSIYRWQGKIEAAVEVTLTMQTTTGAYPALEQRIQERHPYEVPEIIAVPVSHGLPAYLRWVEECAES